MDALVTCIYNGLSGTKFSGRRNRDLLYINSLMAIAGTGVKIFCFTSAADSIYIYRNLAERNITNVTVIILELQDMVYSPTIQKIKDETPANYSEFFWTQRCVEIMWGKFIMLRTVMEQNPELENIFWIDSGLSHTAVISPKYASNPEISMDYLIADLLFTPAFIPKMKCYTKGKILALMSIVPHNPPIPAKYNKRRYSTTAGMIGGLFGGNTEYMATMCESFLEKVDLMLADKLLTSEEGIMSGVLTDYPEMFHTFFFETFYHEFTNEYYNPRLINVSMVFDKILECE